MEDFLINEGMKDLTFLKPTSDNKFIQISGNELKEIINLSKESQKHILPLLRRIDNKNVIEQAAVIKALNQDNINDEMIGKELAKFLEIRLNAISAIGEKGWKTMHNEKKLKITREIRGVRDNYFIDSEFLITPEARAINNYNCVISVCAEVWCLYCARNIDITAEYCIAHILKSAGSR